MLLHNRNGNQNLLVLARCWETHPQSVVRSNIPIFFAQTHDWALGLNVISGRAQINAQVVDDSSNVYIAGSFYGVLNLATDTFSFSSTSNQTIFLAKYDKDGNYKWGKAFTSATSANIIDMVINSQNQIILFGHGGGTLSFGSTTFTRSSCAANYNKRHFY